MVAEEAMAAAAASGNMLNRRQQKMYNKAKATPPSRVKRRKVSRSSVSGDGSAAAAEVSQLLQDSQHFDLSFPTTRYADLGGIEACMQDVRELVELVFTHPELFRHLGFSPPRGILLHGPPGCGKTMLAHAIAGELGVPFLKVGAPELVGGTSGESEARIRRLFEQAGAEAQRSGDGCLVFIDEIDVITVSLSGCSRAPGWGGGPRLLSFPNSSFLARPVCSPSG